MNTSEDTKISEELEKVLIGDRAVHSLCCRSDYLAICGHNCTGNRVSQEDALTCAECIEIDQEANNERCRLISDCIAKRDRD